MANHTKKYNGCSIIYICANIVDAKLSDIAEYIGVSLAGLKKYCTQLRIGGYPLPHQRIVSVGTVTVRYEKGRPVEWVKTVMGWERKAMDKQYYRITEPSKYKGRQPGAKGKKSKIYSKIISEREKPIILPKKKTKRFESRVHEEKVPFYIPELRMTVYVSPNAITSEIREKYIGQRDHERKTVAN